MNTELAADSPDRSRPVHQPVYETDNQSVLVFVTVCTKDRRPLLATPRMHQSLLTVWANASHWLVGRYVIMPDHLHLFCSPGVLPAEPLKPWVSYWKRLVTQTHGEQIWQRDFWDTQLRRHESYTAKWDYVRNNPVRAGLVTRTEDWPYQGELGILRWHG